MSHTICLLNVPTQSKAPDKCGDSSDNLGLGFCPYGKYLFSINDHVENRFGNMLRLPFN
ncbi:MAG: hypothetical protein ACI8RD_004467 [Bacillariaceae sp.]|jgi:hypothetical protein